MSASGMNSLHVFDSELQMIKHYQISFFKTVEKPLQLSFNT